MAQEPGPPGFLKMIGRRGTTCSAPPRRLRAKIEMDLVASDPTAILANTGDLAIIVFTGIFCLIKHLDGVVGTNGFFMDPRRVTRGVRVPSAEILGTRVDAGV